MTPKKLKPIHIGDPRYIAIASRYPFDDPWRAVLKRGIDREGREIAAPVCVYDTMLLSNDVVSVQQSDPITFFEYL